MEGATIKQKDGEISININVNVYIANVEFKGHVNFYTGADNKIHGYDYDGKLTFSKQFKFIGCKVYGKFKAMNCIFNEDANFSKTIFVWSVDFRNSEFEKYAGFDKAIFREDIKYNNDIQPNSSGDTNFSGVIFKYSCSFDEVEFHGKTKFSGLRSVSKNNIDSKYSNFSKDTSFKKAKFFGEVIFHARFGKEEDKNTFKKVDFEEAEFHGKSEFSNSEFNINVSFKGCKFGGNTTFNRATFKGNTYFDGATFEGYAYFIGVTFKGNADFIGATFEGYAYFKPFNFGKHKPTVFKKGADFGGSIFNNYVKFKCIFEDTISFGRAEFNNGVNFSDAEFKFNAEDDPIFFETKFNNANFEGNKFKSLSFRFCESKGYFQFIYENNVEKKFCIDGCSFDGNVVFIENTFEGDVEFLRNRFNDNILFSKVEFNGEKSEFKNLIAEGITEFSEVKFEKNVEFLKCDFEEDGTVKFEDVEFKGDSTFSLNNFKSNVEFVNVKFDNLIFKNSTFKSETKFVDISRLLAFLECSFGDIAYFKKNKERINEGVIIFHQVIFKEPKYVKFINLVLSKTSFLLTDIKEITIMAEPEKILDDYILNLLNEQIKMNNEKKKIYDLLAELIDSGANLNEYNEKLEELTIKTKYKIDKFINFNNNRSYKNFIKILCEILPEFKEKAVLKEYSDLRKSFENNRTYIEASDLFKKEMGLIKRMTTFDERKFAEKIKEYVPILYHNLWYIYIFSPYLILLGFCWTYLKSYPVIFLITLMYVIGVYIIRNSTINKILSKIMTRIAFEVYNITSNYGESLTRPIIISIIIILLFPILLPNINLEFIKPISLFIYNHTPEPFKNTILYYDELFGQTLKAFFQLGTDNELIKPHDWSIRIVSLILLGNIFIAIKRRLERK